MSNYDSLSGCFRMIGMRSIFKVRPTNLDMSQTHWGGTCLENPFQSIGQQTDTLSDSIPYTKHYLKPNKTTPLVYAIQHSHVSTNPWHNSLPFKHGCDDMEKCKLDDILNSFGSIVKEKSLSRWWVCACWRCHFPFEETVQTLHNITCKPQTLKLWW